MFRQPAGYFNHKNIAVKSEVKGSLIVCRYKLKKLFVRTQSIPLDNDLLSFALKS